MENSQGGSDQRLAQLKKDRLADLQAQLSAVEAQIDPKELRQSRDDAEYYQRDGNVVFAPMTW